MTSFDTLRAVWPNLSGTTDQKLAALAAMTVAGPTVDVKTSDVFAYLALAGKLTGLQVYAVSPPNGANANAILAARQLFALPSVGVTTIQMSSPQVYTVVQAWLGALVAETADTGITSADVSVLMALASSSIPWWQANGYTSPISQNDLDAAGGLT